MGETDETHDGAALNCCCVLLKALAHDELEYTEGRSIRKKRACAIYQTGCDLEVGVVVAPLATRQHRSRNLLDRQVGKTIRLASKRRAQHQQ